MRCFVAAASVVALTMPLVAQAPTSQPPPLAGEPRFDVVSIKPSPPNQSLECRPPTCYTSFFVPQPGRFRALRMSVIGLVGYAYSTPSNRLIGPEWTRTEQYDIEATHALKGADDPGLRTMVQRLLQERFALRMHSEQRRTAVYVLTKAREDGRLGPQLVSVAGCDDRPRFLPSSYSKSCGATGVPSATSRVGLATWDRLNLHRQFEQSLDRPVVDETGLSGWYAAYIEWSDDVTQTEKPSLFTAVREQLGLKLETAERPLEVIVIDGAERPSPN